MSESEPKLEPLRPELLELLGKIGREADAVAAPSLAHAARLWDQDDEETIKEMVRRGLAVPLGTHPGMTEES